MTPAQIARAIQVVGIALFAVALYLFGVVGWYTDELWKPVLYFGVLAAGGGVAALGERMYRKALQDSDS